MPPGAATAAARLRGRPSPRNAAGPPCANLVPPRIQKPAPKLQIPRNRGDALPCRQARQRGLLQRRRILPVLRHQFLSSRNCPLFSVSHFWGIPIIGEKERAARTASEFSLSVLGGGEGWVRWGKRPHPPHPIPSRTRWVPSLSPARRAERAKDRSLRGREAAIPFRPGACWVIHRGGQRNAERGIKA